MPDKRCGASALHRNYCIEQVDGLLVHHVPDGGRGGLWIVFSLVVEASNNTPLCHLFGIFTTRMPAQMGRHRDYT